MARISGVDLPRDKRVEVGLSYLFGVGAPLSKRILAEAGLNPDRRVKDLTEHEVHTLQSIVNRGLKGGTSIKVEGDLRREIAQNVKRLIDIGSYRGLRHRKGLPVRGQRTRTNARTRKGPRRTVTNKKVETAR